MSRRKTLHTYGFLPSIHPACSRRVGRGLHLPDVSDSKAPRSSKGDLSPWDSGCHRHGWLPRLRRRGCKGYCSPTRGEEVEPASVGDPGGCPETLLDRLYNIIRAFNDLFGSIDWKYEDDVTKLITETIPARVAAAEAFRNTRQQADPENARIESDKALKRVMNEVIIDDMQLFRHFADD